MKAWPGSQAGGRAQPVRGGLAEPVTPVGAAQARVMHDSMHAAQRTLLSSLPKQVRPPLRPGSAGFAGTASLYRWEHRHACL